MKFETMNCPECGAVAEEVAALVPVQSPLNLVEGEYEFGDTGGRVCWDGQMEDQDEEGRWNLWCPSGHSWWAFLLDEHGQLIEKPKAGVQDVMCGICRQPTPVRTAHLHQGQWIRQECWFERLRAETPRPFRLRGRACRG
jgi:hypothetical protein